MSAPLDHRSAEPGLIATPLSPPRDEQELMRRSRDIAGRTIAELAARVQAPVPNDLRRAKGWVGELIEQCLGAAAGSTPQPDFPHLGIEVKTVPIDGNGRPRESTHVCAITLDEVGASWPESRVRAKLARVLWVPIEAADGIVLAQRRVGQPVLWSPDPKIADQLQRDWEEHMEMIALGRADAIRGEQGVFLQVRPKAASGRSRTATSNAAGGRTSTLPLGFYLRAGFTATMLAGVYASSG
jgi:DNA mismatch repair protein MutH